MFGLGKLFAAVERLAGSLNATADTWDQINKGLRQRFQLDVPEVEADATALAGPARPELLEAANGESPAGRRKPR